MHATLFVTVSQCVECNTRFKLWNVIGFVTLLPKRATRHACRMHVTHHTCMSRITHACHACHIRCHSKHVKAAATAADAPASAAPAPAAAKTTADRQLAANK